MKVRASSSRSFPQRIATVVGASLLVLAAFGAPAHADPQGLHGPNEPVPAGSFVVLDEHSVMIVTHKADGGGTLRIYETRSQPGASLARDSRPTPRAVLDQLKARSVVNQDIPEKGQPGGSDPIPGAGDPVYRCATSYGGAAYLSGTSNCTTKVRWRFGGFSDPQVYFRDHTPSPWPVNASVSKWNQAVGIDSYYLSGGSSCPGGGRHCVDVWNANYGNTWVGYTWIDYDSSYYFNEGGAVVHFNDYWSSAEDNRGTVCHELGHALGLAHNTSVSSCLYYSAVSGTDPQYPDTNDYNVLRYVLYP